MRILDNIYYYRCLRIIKHSLPSNTLNKMLLRFPYLYKTKIINYESNIGLVDIHTLLSFLDSVIDLEGDVIECGSSRCGTAIIMAKYLQKRNVDKTVYALDSFGGYDKEELKKAREEGFTVYDDKSFTSTSFEYVSAKINSLNMNNKVIPIKGFFKNTLPSVVSDRKLCLAFLDCNMKDSTKYCAEMILPSLSKGGIIISDDFYALAGSVGVKYALLEFVSSHQDQIKTSGTKEGLFYIIKS